MECIFVPNMNKGIICIGSNYNGEANLSRCRKLLESAFADIIYSSTCITAPYGTTYTSDFINQLAIIHTEKSKESVIELLKSYEKELGRNSEDKKKGLVKIDIDLIVWNEDILKPEDMKRRYVTELISELEY